MAEQFDFKGLCCAGWVAPDGMFSCEVSPRGITDLVSIEHSHGFETFLSCKKTPAAVSVQSERVWYPILVQVVTLH